MTSFSRLVSLAALALTAAASILPKAGCDNPVIETEKHSIGNGKFITIATTRCPGAKIAERTDDKRICGGLCNTACGNTAGPLPPTVEDCKMISDAVDIMLRGGFPPSFGLQPSESKTLTFGTCSFTTENRGPPSVTQCWVDMASAATRAGSACYPPVMPLHSDGNCTSLDGSWSVISSHSTSS